MSTDDELEKIKQEMMRKLMQPAPKQAGILADGRVTALTDRNFTQAVQKADKPVLVDFWAEWCAPCKMMGPAVEQIAAELSGWAYVAKLNVDENQLTARQYGVMSIPNFIVFKGGTAVNRTVGAVGKEGLVQLVQPFLG